MCMLVFWSPMPDSLVTSDCFRSPVACSLQPVPELHRDTVGSAQGPGFILRLVVILSSQHKHQLESEAAFLLPSRGTGLIKTHSPSTQFRQLLVTPLTRL